MQAIHGDIFFFIRRRKVGMRVICRGGLYARKYGIGLPSTMAQRRGRWDPNPEVTNRVALVQRSRPQEDVSTNSVELWLLSLLTVSAWLNVPQFGSFSGTLWGYSLLGTNETRCKLALLTDQHSNVATCCHKNEHRLQVGGLLHLIFW